MNINRRLIKEGILVVCVIGAVTLGVLYSFKVLEDSMLSSENTESQEDLNIETGWHSMYLTYKTITNDCIETLVECQEVLESYSIIYDKFMPAMLVESQTVAILEYKSAQCM